MLGPCKICGAMDYELSYGGVDICPSCDCGGPTARQYVALAKDNARLREALMRIACANPETYVTRLARSALAEVWNRRAGGKP